MKKFLCLMAVILVFSFIGVGCSEETNKLAVITPEDNVIMTIYTFDGKTESVVGLMNLGHTFLSFENTGEDRVKIGKQTIAPHETITVGTWSIKAHFGVWYNVESNYIDEFDKYNGRGSVSIGINNEDIEKINEYILAHDKWTPLYNCSNFATHVWNTVASEKEQINISAIYTPAKVKNELEKFPSFIENKSIYTGDQLFYFDGDTPVYYNLESAV